MTRATRTGPYPSLLLGLLLAGAAGSAVAQLSLPNPPLGGGAPSLSSDPGRAYEELAQRRRELARRAEELDRWQAPAGAEETRELDQMRGRLDDLERRVAFSEQVRDFLLRNEAAILAFEWKGAIGSGKATSKIRIAQLTVDAGIRAEPKDEAAVLATHPKGTAFLALVDLADDGGGNWTAVWLEGGRPGFVRSALLESIDPAGARP